MIHHRKDYNRIQDPAGLIPEREPVLLVRAKDVMAVPVIELWAALAEKAGASAEIVESVGYLLERVRNYQARYGAHVPTMPAGEGDMGDE